jgi:ribosomal protein L14E/L6E/L27E
MMDCDNLTGRIATSCAGRDKGRSFIIVGVFDNQHVYIADGSLRKLENPKKKKLRHLKVHDIVVEGIRTKINDKKQVFNAEIRNCLLSHGFNRDRISEEE